ncbi:uncharacterized protein C2orf81 homolog [Coturnix japonica]|uniref:uncharacterized protein C2orf81 homolog n=1 Tax=Coturnix japonica TaxID=93934 RepID=UPI0013A5CB41|nr:uncharacterized protein C2orf81 homolog [Coturnix japonica]
MLGVDRYDVVGVTCVPFAVCRARAELLQAVAWRFLLRDEGDAALEALGTWHEDEEPPPGATDSWAEGSVPVLSACPAPEHGQVSSTDADAVPSEDEGGGVSAPSPWSLSQDEELDAFMASDGASWLCGGSSPEPAPLRDPPRAPPNTARPRRLPSIENPKQQEWTEVGGESGSNRHKTPQLLSCSDLLKIWAWSSRCSELRARGRRIIAPRTARLPPLVQWIQPQVEVLDPGTETKQRPRPPRRRREPRGPSGQNMGPGGSWPPRGMAAVGAPRLLPPIVGAEQPSSSESLVLGSSLDTVQLAPGVTIRYGGSEGLCVPVHRVDAD